MFLLVLVVLVVLAPHIISFDFHQICYVFDGFGGFGCSCLFWWFWWILVGSPWGTPYHSLWFLSDLVVFGGFSCFCLFWLFCWFWHPLSFPLISIRFASLFDGFGVFFVFLLVLVVLVVFGKVSLGHSLPFPSISIRFGGFWWFWLFLFVLVVLVVLAPPIISFDVHQIC